ncbi:MAG: hypothetical protein V4488_25630 [Pseudomonadota bacterium]
MKLVFRAAFALLMLSISSWAWASQEGVLSLNSFQFSSAGIGNSGPVIISGEQNAQRFLSLTVSAFRRRVSLNQEQLAKLKAGLFNGVQMSYDSGWKEVGGHTVYIVLSMGFTSGVKSSQIVSVNERGIVEVRPEASK